MTVPVNILSGFLGVGKTTAILDAFQYRPADQRWAVLVNEFGEVGIDGAALQAGGGYVVKEIAGGCICCTAGPMMKTALVRLLREEKPDRVLIEPTGLAHPAAILDVLRSPGLREAVTPRAILGLVNPCQFTQARYQNHETYRDQLEMADLLIANHWDTATESDRTAFLRAAKDWFPPKLGVHTTQMGRLQRQWLDVEPRVLQIQRHQHDPDGASAPAPSMPNASSGKAHQIGAFSTCGWVFPTDLVFDRLPLMEVLQNLIQPEDGPATGALRLKGVFRTRRVWLHVNGTPQALTVKAINYRRDSRLELIFDSQPPDWDAIERAVLGAVCAGAG